MKSTFIFMMFILLSSWVFAQNEELKKLPKGEIFVNNTINTNQLYVTKSNISILKADKQNQSNVLFETGAYKNNTSYKEQCRAVKLPEITNGNERINLHISEMYEIESYHDQGKVLVSDNNGKTWKTVSVRSGKSKKSTQIIDLTRYAGKKVIIAFKLVSDSSYNFDGWTVFSAEVKLEELKGYSSSNTLKAGSTRAGLSGTFTGVEDKEFGQTPSVIKLICEVNNNGLPVSNLDKTNFTITETVDSIWTYNPKWPKDSLHVEYADYKNDINFLVKSPTSVTTTKKVDIVFLMDNSGSMGDEQAAISTNVKSFLNKLKNSGIEAKIGLCRFGQGANGGAPIITKNSLGSWWTDYAGASNPFDIDDFINKWDTENTTNGSIEVSYDAMVQSAMSGEFVFTQGAQKIFIHITDEPMAGTNAQHSKVTDVQVVIKELKARDISLYALCPDNSTFRNEFETISKATGGKFFNITHPFDVILNDISTNVSSKYEIIYSATRNVYDGLQRDIEINVDCSLGNTTLSGKSYTPGAAPIVSPTATTWSKYHTSPYPYPDDQDAPISVNVIDKIAPFAHNPGGYVKLFYRVLGTGATYKELSMVNTSINGDTAVWLATIPAAHLSKPGMEYYIKAYDTESANITPTTPLVYRWSFAVWPNFKPVLADSTAYVNHATALPDSIYKTGYNVEDVIDFRVMASDNTIYVASVELYVKTPLDNSAFKPRNLTLIKDSIYGIKFSLDSIMGVTKYFFTATDNYGVTSFYGSENKPYVIDTRKNIQARHTVALSWGRPPRIEKTLCKVLGQNLSDGDSIKIFFKDKNKLKQSISVCYRNTGLGTIELKDNDVFTLGKNGFYLGDEIIFKVWQKSSGRLYDAVSYPKVTFTDKALTLMDSVIVYGQEVKVPSGADYLWSTSANMMDYSFESVLKYCSNKVALVRDNEDNEWRPNASNNTLKNYVPGYGYKVTLASGVSSLDLLTIGEQRDFSKDSVFIPVYTNTPNNSIVGCPYSSPQGLDHIVGSADISSITKKDGAVTYTYYPGYLSYSTWQTDLNMYPGHAYYMDANNANHYFKFPTPKGTTSASTIKSSGVKTVNQIVNDDSNYMHVILPETSWASTAVNGNMVKAYNTSGELIGQNTVFNNGTSMLIDGTKLENGENFELRYVDVSSGKENQIQIDSWEKGDEKYAAHKMAVASKLKLTKKQSTQTDFVSVFPNPAKDVLTVTIALTQNGSANIKLKDAAGKDYYSSYNIDCIKGNNKLQIPVSTLPKGVYFLTINTQNGNKTTKKVIIK